MADGGRARRTSGKGMAFTALELTGRSATHLVTLSDPPCVLHQAVAAPFLRLRRAAARAGIDLRPASAFRSFEQQLRIWNEKWAGRRVLRDAAGRVLEPGALTDRQRLRAMLAWSALPGASRHHWGTELDVWDAAAVPSGYSLALVSGEYAPDGVFAPLGAWLDRHMHRYGFYRPYQRDRGGVQPEPWHLSHAPTAGEASRRFRLATLRAALSGAPLDGRSLVLAELPRIYARYVRTVERAPRAARLSRATAP